MPQNVRVHASGSEINAFLKLRNALITRGFLTVHSEITDTGSFGTINQNILVSIVHLSDNVDKVSDFFQYYLMIPKVGSDNSVIRLFRIIKEGRVKVGTTLCFNLFGSVD